MDGIGLLLACGFPTIPDLKRNRRRQSSSTARVKEQGWRPITPWYRRPALQFSSGETLLGVALRSVARSPGSWNEPCGHRLGI